MRDAYATASSRTRSGAASSSPSCTAGRGRTPRPVALSNQAVGWLRRNRVLLPKCRCWPSRSPWCARWRRSGCMPRWPGPPGGRTARCLRTWWRCSRCRRGAGCRSWSGYAGRRRGRPAPAWPRRWSGWKRSRRSDWAG
ncbi:hypothetical protein ACFV83_07885 [Streptomyces pharetrae]|uniref:hypothetical protein n=1 Tax=Streptomyces pharetrae TaxID=291370 RepID=UPI0036679DC7